MGLFWKSAAEAARWSLLTPLAERPCPLVAEKEMASLAPQESNKANNERKCQIYLGSNSAKLWSISFEQKEGHILTDICKGHAHAFRAGFSSSAAVTDASLSFTGGCFDSKGIMLWSIRKHLSTISRYVWLMGDVVPCIHLPPCPRTFSRSLVGSTPLGIMLEPSCSHKPHLWHIRGAQGSENGLESPSHLSPACVQVFLWPQEKEDPVTYSIS